MALNYITLVLDLADGTGTPLATGQALLNLSAQLTDATDDMIVTKAQLSAKLAGSYPQVRLLATDNTALFDDYDGMMQCRCGTPSCRATIGGQDWQRPDLQRKYGNYFSSYLLHRLARQPDRPG
jgi:hypothetical protein